MAQPLTTKPLAAHYRENMNWTTGDMEVEKQQPLVGDLWVCWGCCQEWAKKTAREYVEEKDRETGTETETEVE